MGTKILKLAAFAGGISVNPTARPKSGLMVVDPTKRNQTITLWNPEISTSQAFELAILAGIRTETDHEFAYASYPMISTTSPEGNGDWATVRQPLNDEPFKAMRKAVTNAAAKLGSLMLAIERESKS